MSDVEPQDVVQLLKLTLHEVCHEARLLGMRFDFRRVSSEEKEPPVLAPHVVEALKVRSSKAAVFQRSVGTRLCWDELWSV